MRRARPSRLPIRGVASATIALGILAGLAVVAGVGFAATNSSGSAAYQYQYGHKVVICHHTGSKSHPTVTISIDQHALPAHLKHGDTVGACQTTPTVSTAAKPGKSKAHGKSKHQTTTTSTTSTTTAATTKAHTKSKSHGNAKHHS